ncbi:MAG: D-sedoheptulose 7-phosphate isomerase [Bacteroidia bacterium]|nr:D-sedoheptulose 7-phosphate isomerase [Bacteroidia bacterium]
MATDMIRGDLSEALNIIEKFLADSKNISAIEKVGDEMVKAFRSGNKVISCGNGGSMTDAMHFAEELSGKFRKDRPSLPAIAISDPSYITCTANDYGYEFIFSRFIESLGTKGDILLAISTSGNSGNIVKAAETAKSNGMFVIGLTGKDGGKLASVCDIEIRAPYSEYSDRVQEIHIKIIHTLIHYIEQKLNLGLI